MPSLIAVLWIGGAVAFLFCLWCAAIARTLAWALLRLFR